MSFDTKTRDIYSLDKDKNKVERHLEMPAKLIQSVYKNLVHSLKGLKESKKRGRKTGKHIAAVLYAIGRRLDDNPLLFLELRGIDVKEFTSSIIKKEAERIWATVDKKIDSERLVKDEDAAKLFGFEKSAII